MFNRENVRVRKLSEELEEIGLDPNRVLDDIERNSGVLEEHTGSPPSSEAVRSKLYEEVDANADDDVDADADADDSDLDEDIEAAGVVEWDGADDLADDEEVSFLGEKMVRHKKGFRVDPKSGKLKKVKTSDKRKEKSKRRKKRGKMRAAAKMYRKRFKTKIKKRAKRRKASGKQKAGFIVRQEGVAAQLNQLREELEESNTNMGEVTPHEEAALNAGLLALLLGECFETMGDSDAGEMLYKMSDSAADLSEAIEAVGGELDEGLETKLTSLLEGVTKALATHEEIGSPSLFESIEMGAENGLYEDDDDDDDEDDYIDEDDDGDTDTDIGDDADDDAGDDESNDDVIDFDDDE
jgi:hypothetical protein